LSTERIDAAAAFSGVKAVEPAHRLDEAALDAWLRGHVEGYAGPLTVLQFKGGQSNPTYQLVTPDRKYVLRKKPAGKLLPSAHAVDREYRVIAALHPTGFPVARPYALCTDDGVIGTAFYVMAMAEGRIVWDDLMPGVTAAHRSAVYGDMIATLARLHSFEPTTLGLGDYGKPGNYLARQVDRWSRQYRQSETERYPQMDRVMAWLPTTLPPGDEARLVHGDFRLDNIVLHAVEPRVLAVLDWELSTLGNPHADFAYHLMMYRMPAVSVGVLLGQDLDALGLPTEPEYVAAYCARRGLREVPDLGYYMAFCLFRMAGILHGIRGRVQRGTAVSPQAKRYAAAVETVADLAWKQAESTGLR